MADSALRILESEYAQKRIRAELEKDRRREEVFARIPELQALDMRKRRLIVSRFRAKRAGEEAEDISSQVQAIEARMREMLKGNGYSADYLENVYECPQCGDTGVLPQGKRCPCFTKRLLERLYRSASLEGAQEQTFERFDDGIFSRERDPQTGVSPYEAMQNIKKYCLRYAETFPRNKKPNILFSGQTGTGKTFLLNCMAGRILERGYSVLSITASRLIEVLRKAAFEGGGALERLYEIDLLIIDELGMEPMLNNVVVEYLFMVINERCRSGKALLISTNLTPDQLAQRYTERIASRLLDTQNSRCLRFIGDDLRLRKRENFVKKDLR